MFYFVFFYDIFLFIVYVCFYRYYTVRRVVKLLYCCIDTFMFVVLYNIFGIYIIVFNSDCVLFRVYNFLLLI